MKNRSHGDWQGSSIFELYKENGLKIFTETPKNGESLTEFNERIDSVIKKLVDENKGNRIILVTTQEIIQSALANVLALAPENQHKILIKTGTITQISYFEDWASVIYSGYTPI